MHAPVAEREQDRLEVSPPRGQLVHPRTGRGGQVTAADDAAALQLAQPVSDQVGARAGQGAAQAGEALRSEQQFAHDEQGLAFPDDVQGAGRLRAG